MEKYKLNSKIDTKLLLEYGFKQCGSGLCRLRKNLYKDMIVLNLEIDLNKNEFTYEIRDVLNDCKYYPSDNGFGKNVVKDTVTNNLEKEFYKLKISKIFI